jgi:hypothetical protein
MDSNIVWSTLFGAGVAYEAYTILNKKNGDTLSERTRTWFHTRTKAGKIVFSVAWITFATWYLIHIIGG